MPTRRAEARWEGGLKDGKGRIAVESGAFEVPYSFAKRFGDEKGTNPEELIGAAHAGCFTMAFAKRLEDAGHPPRSLHTRAEVIFENLATGFAITNIKLHTEGNVPGMDESQFKDLAEEAKISCPVSKALHGVIIDLDARLTT
jgi:osmotically inducible protein OsmC